MQVAVRGEYDPELRAEFDTDEAFAVRTFYVGRPEETPGDEPQAWLIEYRPKKGGMIKPHFHKAPQFQVVLGGGGRLGKTPVHGGSFQFADAYTPYGPIVPETQEEGIDFYTLRASVRPGTFWMPGSREAMGGRHAGRNVVSEVPDEPLLATGVEHRTLIEPHDDGLAAFFMRLGPGEEMVAPPAGRSGGQYHIVFRGSLRDGARDLPAHALAFVATDEEPPTLVAGDDGCDVLIVQYPDPVAAER